MADTTTTASAAGAATPVRLRGTTVAPREPPDDRAAAAGGSPGKGPGPKAPAPEGADDPDPSGGTHRPPPKTPIEDDPEDRAAGQKPPIKKSVGVILTRVSAETRRPEALLAHKRYTYAFAEFVHGRYARGRGGTPRGVVLLLEQMTTEELLDVWSLDFSLMWRRVWLSRGVDDFYHKKHAKFQSTFMREDGGAALRRAVSQTRSRGVCLWEVPKGRRLGPRESDISCAVRELREETGIDKSEYRILPGVKRRVSYVSAGTRYVCLYYIAAANPRLAGARPSAQRPALRAIGDMGEVGETQWHDIEQIRLLDAAGARLEDLVAPAFRLLKKYRKGQWATRRAAAATLSLSGPAPPAPPDEGEPPRAKATAPAVRRGGPAEGRARARDGAEGSGSDDGGWRRVRRGRRTRAPTEGGLRSPLSGRGAR